MPEPREKKKGPRIFTGADGLSPDDLLRSSVDHLKAAQHLFKSSPSYYDSAGYLAQLSIELLLKAWLLQSAGKFGAIHVLRDLHVELMGKHGAEALSGSQTETLTLLDRFSDLRYPNRNNPVDVGTESVQGIVDLFDAIYTQLPQKLLDGVASADPLRKGGRRLMKKKIKTP